MSYQLWVSPSTGYRRRGTRVAELRRLFEQGLTTTVLYEPLRCCHLDDPQDGVSEEMKRLGFDVVGVIEAKGKSPVGYVAGVDLERKTCREALRPFAQSDLVTDSTPLLDLLEVLASSERRFVLARNRVHGIVTRADLQKPPVRILLFGLISLLEMHLTFWAKAAYRGDHWTQGLKAERTKTAAAILKLRAQRNEQISLFDCIQFCDKRDLAIGNDMIREQMKLGSKKTAGKLLRAAERLRDRLAHSQADLAGPDS